MWLLALAHVLATQDGRFPLATFPLLSARQGFGALGIDRSVQGKPLRVAGEEFARGFGSHAAGQMTFLLQGKAARFEASVGVDDEIAYTHHASIEFKVLGDGRELFASGTMHSGDAPRRIAVDVSGVQELTLVATDAGDGIDSDHADWLEPTLTRKGAADASVDLSKSHEVKAKGIAVRISETGEVMGLKLADCKERKVEARTWLMGTSGAGETETTKLANGWEFTRSETVGRPARRCQVTDRFTTAGGSVRWEVEIQSAGAPWSTPVTTLLHWPSADKARIWAPWQDPVDSHSGLGMAESETPWNDPMVPQPFRTRTLSYGQATSGSWWQGDTITLPLLSILDPTVDRGLSLIQSPEDDLIEGEAMSGEGGWIGFTRSQRRFGEGKAVRYAMDLVPQHADPRGGLAWMAKRYAKFFDPPNPSVNKLAGLAAYSGDERILDDDTAKKLDKMAFRVMWKLSDDYAYMGLFLPPVKGEDARWNRVDDSGSPPNYKPIWTSDRRLNDYAKMLESHGFHLLSYFNTTEYGLNMKDVPAPKNPLDPDLWKDSSAYLKANMPNAPVRIGGTGPLGAWQGGWVVDPGDPGYMAHLLSQAERHIKMVPASVGVCIDRADYLRLHNDAADDGVSLYDGRKTRSLTVSWRNMMSQLGPLMHRNGKVVFSNLMHPRLDLARQIDGIYDEFGNQPTVLNGAAFLCLYKPMLAWTRNEDVLNDAFFQRHLYLGAFPTAPYPTNNHCIEPSPERDKWYLDYGPLFDQLRGRKWVLKDHVIEADGGAKANAFEVPGGYAVAVTFAGAAKSVRVTLRGLKISKPGKVWLPGDEKPRNIFREKIVGLSEETKAEVTFDVPVSRGAAVVVIR